MLYISLVPFIFSYCSYCTNRYCQRSDTVETDPNKVCSIFCVQYHFREGGSTTFVASKIDYIIDAFSELLVYGNMFAIVDLTSTEKKAKRHFNLILKRCEFSLVCA